MFAPELTSIPLPADPPSTRAMVKPVEGMSLEDHSSAIVSKQPGVDRSHISPALTAVVGLDGKQSSQRIVDQLFKDFIAQKITSTSRVSKDAGNDKTVSLVRNSTEEISKLLDMEIKLITSSTESKDKFVDKKDQKSHSLSKHSQFVSDFGLGKEQKSSCGDVFISNSDTSVASIQSPKSICASENKEAALKCQLMVDSKAHVAAGPTSGTLHAVSQNKATMSPWTTQPADSTQPAIGLSVPTLKSNVTLPFPLAKKVTHPKVLGVKLSTESLSLITSTDRIDRGGRVWEEGEVCSSGSEDSDKDEDSESDLDGFPSDTGSVHSNSGDWKTQSSRHKRKHKHRHKKKKKHSSREKDGDLKEKDKHTKLESKKQERSRRKSKDHDEMDNEKHRGRSNKGSDKDASSKDKENSKVDKVDSDHVKEGTEKHSREKHKSADREHEMRRRDSGRKRHSSHSRSRSPKRRKKSKSRTHSRSKSPKRHRSRSRSSSPRTTHGSGRYGEWDARHYSDDPSKFCSRSRSRSRDRSSDRHGQSRDRSKSDERERSKESNDGDDLRMKIDKAKLRKIAIANALQNMKSGQGPQLDLTLAKSGGKSVEELTEFCKRISEKSKAEDASDKSSDEETEKKSDDDDMLIHHPFKVKEASSVGIVMNIRNAKQLPILTPSEKQAQQATLRLTFPVSSGSQHRASESEWVPVPTTSAVTTPAPQPAAASQVTNIMPQVNANSGSSIFPDQSEGQKIDIGAIISERLQAVRKLQENPYDVQALSKMHQVQQQASRWATSRHLPGQFMGSTGVNVLTQEQLIGDRRHQAWARKTQLSQAAPVSGGIGMFLLQKMGWKQGEGLGKNNEGSREPLLLDIKVDRKGLTTAAENPRHRPQAATAAPRAKDLSNKHPVSALMELCNRRKWGPPMFTVVSESGPDHKKNFLFKVRVNNVEYQPASPSTNKKMAKALCAAICLQEMGLLPRDAPLNI